MAAGDAAAAMMRGLSQAIDDMVKISAVKAQFEEAERKQIEWERNEKMRNSVVDFSASAWYQSMSPEWQKKFSDRMKVSGWSDDGKTAKMWQLEGAKKVLGMDKEFATYTIDEINNGYKQQIAKNLEKIRNNPKLEDELSKQNRILEEKIHANLGTLTELREKWDNMDKAKRLIQLKQEEVNIARDAERNKGRLIDAQVRDYQAREKGLGAYQRWPPGTSKEEQLKYEKDLRRAEQKAKFATETVGILVGTGGQGILGAKNKQQRINAISNVLDSLRMTQHMYPDLDVQNDLDPMISTIFERSSKLKPYMDEYREAVGIQKSAGPSEEKPAAINPQPKAKTSSVILGDVNPALDYGPVRRRIKQTIPSDITPGEENE